MDYLYFIFYSIFLMLWNLSYIWWAEESRGRASNKIVWGLNVLSFCFLFIGMMRDDDTTVVEILILALKAGLLQLVFVLSGAVFIHIIMPRINKYRNKKPRAPKFSAVDL